MKNIIGIIRRIDDNGRILIPKEIRKYLGIEEGMPLEIFTEGSKIILKKFRTNTCKYCKKTLNESDKYCSNCGKKVENDE